MNFVCKLSTIFEFSDQNLNSHLLHLLISYRSSGEKLIKYQPSKFNLV